MGSILAFNTNECINYELGRGCEKKIARGIFIYCETGVVFQGLAKSLEQTFADVRTTLSRCLPDPKDFDPDVGLVLLHAELVTDLSACIELCRRCFPNASITLMINGDGLTSLGSTRLLGDKRIQGFLPFSLKLDIWLAAIWLLLNGGEYYPYGAIQSLESRTKNDQTGYQKSGICVDERICTADTLPIDTLTAREHQILELLSEGLQNKIIAHKLNLSGHTIKVHVHNLMRKLNVHNRTQAAAVYRNHLDRGALQSDFGWNTTRAINRNTVIAGSIANIRRKNLIVA